MDITEKYINIFIYFSIVVLENFIEIVFIVQFNFLYRKDNSGIILISDPVVI